MKRMVLISLLVLSLSPLSVRAETLKSTMEDQQSVSLTVYNSNLGLVKDLRKVKLDAGTHELQFMDVASQINPVTVHIASVSQPEGLVVLEQNYEYDLLNPRKLMDKYVGKMVKLERVNYYTDKKEIVNAQLLSANEGTVYRINDEIHVNPAGTVIYPEIPDNLIAKPTLVWLLQNKETKEQTVEVFYLTGGISWNADYIAVLNEDNTKTDLSGWVTIQNQSGATYKNAKLKLVAGDVNQVTDQFAAHELRRYDLEMAAAKSPAFEEEAFFEYHLYTLQRSSTIKQNQSKQIELISVHDVPVQERLIYYGARHYYRSQMTGEMLSNQKVGAFIEIENREKNNLGIPLPKGVVRAYKKDAEGALQFIGEDRIDHTPKDEKIKIKMGDSFDVVAERKQTDYKILSKNVLQRFDVEMEWEISLRNHKEKKVIVEVMEPIYADWEMVNSSHPFEKVEAHTIKYIVTLAPDGSETIKYRIKVRWW